MWTWVVIDYFTKIIFVFETPKNTVFTVVVVVVVVYGRKTDIMRSSDIGMILTATRPNCKPIFEKG